jgi:hypothetical protein
MQHRSDIHLLETSGAIVIRDVNIEALWKKGALASMLSLDKALHGRSLQ